MSESNLFKLLDFNPLNDDFDKQMINADAIIKEARQNPHDVDSMYTFPYRVKYKCRCPLHQAIVLGLSVEVVEALSSPISIKQTINGATALHFACEHGASLDVVSLLLSSWPDGVKEKNRHGSTALHVACRCKASLDV
eukprot:15345489-Ditylum_brightwellii.AAC.1